MAPDLTRTLSFFSSTSMDAVFDQFAEGNWSQLAELADKITPEQRHELAQLMVALADVTEKTRNLMEWVYVSEVEAAANSMMIFKTDINMMSTIVGNYLCYSYSCIRWLKFITVPLVNYLESQAHQADATTPQGVAVLLGASEITLSNFFNSILDVPLWLRQSCMAYQVASNKKFGVVKGNPRPPGLLCGYLVSVLTTEKNAVIGDVSLKIKNGLRAVASLLLQLGYQFGTINNPELQAFIAKKTPCLVQYYDEFVSPEGIAMSEQILACSKPRVFAKDIRLRTKRQRFAKMMMSFSNPSTGDIETTSHTSEGSGFSDAEFVSKTDCHHLLQKIDYGDWRHSKTLKCGATTSSWRSDDSHTISLKLDIRVQASLEEAAAWFSTKYKDPELDPMIGHTSRVRVTENMHHLYGFVEFPWPLGNRTFSLYQCEFLDRGKNMITFVHKHAAYPGVKKKGYVETKTYLSGIRLVVDSHDSNFVNVTIVVHKDPGGSCPNWFIHRIVAAQTEKFVKMAKVLEEQTKKKPSIATPPMASRLRKI